MCRYIAKTLYGEDDDDVALDQHKGSVQEPKLLGLHPGSEEKVWFMIVYAVYLLLLVTPFTNLRYSASLL